MRAKQAAARREAILAAALEEFASRGFAATRLDDVARRAGVAKGTIYLHFRDKEALFQELIRSSLGPIIGTLQSAPMADLSLRTFMETFATLFAEQVYGTPRAAVIRLILTEGARFPRLAEIYYREIIKPAVGAMRALAARAVARGEIGSDALVRFPHLIVAPGLVAIMWQALFGAYEPLDAAVMLRTHVRLLFSALEKEAS